MAPPGDLVASEVHSFSRTNKGFCARENVPKSGDATPLSGLACSNVPFIWDQAKDFKKCR